MDELVDILDEYGNYTGKSILKSEAHLKGLFHPTVHIWCYSKSGKILLQQRGAMKKTYPLKWDVSVAGHVSAGESIFNAAVREIEEEIGVTVNDKQLEKFGVFKTEKRHSETIWDREFNYTFFCELNEKTKLTKQKSEVEAVEWTTITDFEKRIAADDESLVPNSSERYQKIISAIKRRLQ